MVRRILLGVVLVAVGLALINGAVVAQLPGEWVPSTLVLGQKYVSAEGAVLCGVFGLGLILLAFTSYRHRLWVILAILYGILNVAVQVDRYYGGRGDVLPAVAFWVVATVLMAILFPTRIRPASSVTRRPVARSLAGAGQASAGQRPT